MLTATPYKLHSGAWGAKVRSENVSEGDRVMVHAASGKSWPVTVTRVFWSGDGSAIVATESADGGPRRGGSRPRRTPAPRPAPAVTAAPKPAPPDADDYVPAWVDDYAEDWSDVAPF